MTLIKANETRFVPFYSLALQLKDALLGSNEYAIASSLEKQQKHLGKYQNKKQQTQV